MVSYRDNLMTCEEAMVVSLLYITDDPDLALPRRTGFEAHLLVCPDCAAEHEENLWLSGQLRRHGTIGESTRRLLQMAGHEIERPAGTSPGGAGDEPWRPMTAEEGWADLKRRCPDLAAACRRQESRQRRRKLFMQVGGLAAAACVLIAIGIGWLTPRDRTPWNSNVAPAGRSGDLLAQASAELVTADGRRPVALNQPFQAADQPLEILLGGMHRVVMNRQTTATFKAVPASARHEGPGPRPTPPGGRLADLAAQYEIELASGELFVEVVPGHPFTVTTGQALLRITGTKFDVRADSGRTDLTLLKGSVRFSQVREATAATVAGRGVDVTAGQASTIAGRSAPTAPRATDALAATAWARDLVLRNAIARSRQAADLQPLDSVRDFRTQTSPPDLGAIDYAQWRDAHRDWFAREFPWTFDVQRALKERHGIEADYIELLVVSGDIWQFNCPRPLGQPMAIFTSASVRQLAAHYQVDPAELLAAAEPTATAEPSAERSVEKLLARYAASLGLWQRAAAGLRAADGNLDGHQLMFTLRAGTYLATSRTAVWLWLRAHPEQAAALWPWQMMPNGPSSMTIDTRSAAAAGDGGPWLSQLSQEIAAANRIGRLAQELVTLPAAAGCETQGAVLSAELAAAIAALAPPADSP